MPRAVPSQSCDLDKFPGQGLGDRTPGGSPDLDIPGGRESCEEFVNPSGEESGGSL